MTQRADVNDLLAHADWLRRLAGHLVWGDGDVGDVVQQTWVAALRTPPAADRPPRPWLAEVLRNFARKAHRERQTRNRREESNSAAAEAALASASGPPSAETLLEAAELQRVLADLVVALEEPYRTTILLRFYRGIEPTEIARSTGVPAGTVRWRVSEAIRRLRASLDSRPGDWRRSLLPFLGGTAPPSLALKGALIMSTKAKLGVAAIVVAALAIGARTWSARPRPAASPAVTVADVERGVATAPAVAGRAASMTAEPSVARGGSERQPLGRARAAVRPLPKLVSAPPLPPAPAATQTPPGDARGSMDKDQIRRAMRRVIPVLKQCYAKLLEDQPGASGRLVVGFTITDAGGVGRISEASIVPKSADGGAPELIAPLTEQCMLNAIAEASFPAPEGGPVVVTYPFTFSPDGDLIPGAARTAPRSDPAPAP